MSHDQAAISKILLLLKNRMSQFTVVRGVKLFVMFALEDVADGQGQGKFVGVYFGKSAGSGNWRINRTANRIMNTRRANKCKRKMSNTVGAHVHVRDFVSSSWLAWSGGDPPLCSACSSISLVPVP